MNSNTHPFSTRVGIQPCLGLCVGILLTACGEKGGPSLLGTNTMQVGHISTSPASTSPSISYSNIDGIRGVFMTMSPLTTANSGTYSLVVGTLPSGLTLNSNTGVISGTPTTLQSSTAYQVAVTDSTSNAVTSSSFNISISENWTDQSNANVGFGGGTSSGISWDSTQSFLRITNTGSTVNNSQLDASWTPQWAHLVAYYQMDNNWNDSSINGNNGTAVGAPTFSSDAKVGVASGSFNGASSVNIPDSATLDFSTEFTVMTWIFIASSSHNFWLFSKNAPGFATGYGIAFEHPTGKIWPHLGIAGSLTNPKSNGATAYNQWNQVVLTYDGTNIIIYINGQLDSTIPQTGTFGTNSNELRIGDSPGSPGEFLDGKIDDLAIWNKALTFSEVRSIYNRQLSKYGGTFQSRVFDNQTGTALTGIQWITPLPFGKELTGDADGSGTISSSDSETSADYSSIATNTLMNNLQGLWHLNESSATGGGSNDFADSSGNSRNGEASGGVTFGGSGIFSNSAQFTASGNGSIALSSFPNLTTQMSFEAWVNPSSTPGTGVTYTLMAKGNNSVADDLNFSFDYRNVSGTLRLEASWSQPASTVIEYYVPITLPLYTWSHIAWTVDWSTNPDAVNLYVNGISQSLTRSGSNNATPTTTAPQLTRLGALPTGSNFHNGFLDEVAVWDRILSASEILQLYRRGTNRVKFQIRACTSSNCGDSPQWTGPDGSSSTYFSELQNYQPYSYLTHNCSASNLILVGNPDLWFQCLTGFTSVFPSNRRYIQYQAVFESEDSGTGCNYGGGSTWCSPELKRVEIRP